MEAEKKGQRAVEAEKGKATVEVVEENTEKGDAAAKEVAGEDMITLKSSDAKLFKVPAAAARLSPVLGKMIKEGCAGDVIPLKQIGSEALAMVVDYCNEHSNANSGDPSAAAGSSSGFDTATSKDLEAWDRKLVDRLSHDALFDLIEAADFLSIDGLLDIACRKVADEIRGKTPAQIRATFNIKNDFTPDEEEQVRREHGWAFTD